VDLQKFQILRDLLKEIHQLNLEQLLRYAVQSGLPKPIRT
jgi:hypothetical protein